MSMRVETCIVTLSRSQLSWKARYSWVQYLAVSGFLAFAVMFLRCVSVALVLCPPLTVVERCKMPSNNGALCRCWLCSRGPVMHSDTSAQRQTNQVTGSREQTVCCVLCALGGGS